jgi:hypothetical protein
MKTPLTKRFYRFIACIILALNIYVCLAQEVNVNLSNADNFDGEPYLAVNPTNNQNLVVAWMGVNVNASPVEVAVTVRSSFDGGNTWSNKIALPHNGTGFTSADISMAFDKNGLLYLSFIDWNTLAVKGGDFITRSRDGGLTWDSASEVTNVDENLLKDPIDRPWLVADNSNTNNFGTLYITSKPAPFIPPPNRNYYKVSTDSGHTWTALANVDGGNYLVGSLIQAPMAAPATTVNGNFCAVYPSYVASQNIYPAFYLATSNNKGQTLAYSTVIVYPPQTLDSNLKSGYKLAADPIDSNNMALFLVSGQNGDADIMALHTTNGGQSWSAAVRVNDDSIHNGKDQDMVWCAYNEQGNLAAAWRDRRNADATGFWGAGYDFYYALSSDNGQTFSSNQKLTSTFVAFDSVIARAGNDFMSCAYVGDTLYSVWGDTRTGALNIFFTKTTASTDSITGVVQLEGSPAEWSVFPDPASDVVNIVVSGELIGKPISIYDFGGRKMYSGNIPGLHFNLPVSDWAAGAYFISLDNSVRKFVKE